MVSKFKDSMNASPLISIVTPNYNCAKFISETIESVLAQDYQNWEMLIQDDCSSDKSYQIALEYAKQDSRIKVERNESNSGAAVTRNNAIRRSQGEYLAFLDSDDLWLPNKLSKQLKFMMDNDCDFSFTKYEHMDEDGKSLLEQAQVTKKLNYTKLMMHCWPGCLTVMYRQVVANKIYAGDVKKNNDHALFLRVMRQCKNGMGLDECLALYRIRKGSISRNKFKVLQPFVTVLHDFEHKSYITAYFCVFTHMFVKTLFKYKKIEEKDSIVNLLTTQA